MTSLIAEPALQKTHTFQNLATNLALLLQQANTTESKLAKSLNLPYITIRRLLNGETTDPHLSTLKLISDFFNVSLDILTGTPTCLNQTRHPAAIPVLDWRQITQPQTPPLLAQGALQTIVPTIAISNNAFALISKPCMSPRFPVNTLLIFDPQKIYKDGDYVMVVYQDIQTASVKKIVLDGRTRHLIDINKQTEEPICPHTLLHSVLVEWRFIYKT